MFAKHPLLVITLRNNLIVLLNESENIKRDLDDIILKTTGNLLYQTWAQNIIAYYFKAQLHQISNQSEIQSALLNHVKPHVIYQLSKKRKLQNV